MAVDTAPKLTRRRNVACAIETTTGTAASLTDADGTFFCFNPQMTFTTEEVERDSQGTSVSPELSAKGARAGRFTCETEVVGAGASGSPLWTRLLQICGWTNNAGVWSPVTGPTATGTIGFYQSGVLRMLAGCMGTFTMTVRRGQKARIAWDIQGVQAPPTDTANIAPTMTTVIAPRAGSNTFTVDGIAMRAAEVTFEAGNDVQMREDLGAVDSASEPTGYRNAMIVNRKPMVRVSPEAQVLGTVDWQDLYRDATTFALALDWGTASNNTFALAAPKLQLTADPNYGDRNGLLTNDLVAMCVRNSDAGDDEVTLTLS